jgi:RNA polymerase sigma-70 factor (ECF subfamily)
MVLIREDELLDRCKRGERDAFGPIVRTYEGRIYAYAATMVRDGEEAKDLTQETFIRAYTRLHQFELGRPFLPWLMSIARSRCIDSIRARRSRTQYEVHGGEMLSNRPDPATGTGAIMDDEDRRSMVWQALSRLRPQEREILTLKDISELKYDEVARILGIPRGTVASRVFMARRALAQQIG